MAVLHWSSAEPGNLMVATGGAVEKGHMERGHICQKLTIKEKMLPMPSAISGCFLVHCCVKNLLFKNTPHMLQMA